MAKNIKNARWKRNLSAFSILLFFAAAGAETLVDRIMARVGKQAITLREVRTAALIDAVLEKKAPPAEDTEPAEGTLRAMIRRMLINNHMDGIGEETAAPADRVAQMKAALAPKKAYFTQRGIGEAEIDRELRSRIRSDLFIEQHLLFRINITAEETRARYNAEKSGRFLGKPFESVENIVRAELRKERLQKETDQWLETETRRTEVILPAPSK